VLTTDPTQNGFTFDTLNAPFSVSAGQTFTIGEVMAGDPIGYFCAGGCGNGPMTVAPQITVNGAVYSGSGPILSLPTNGWSHIDWGPDFQLSAVPEPSFLLMLGAGLASVMGMVGAARRKLI